MLPLIDQNTTQQEFLTILLKNRHLKKEDLNEFLNPTDPKKLPLKNFNVSQTQLDKAVKRIKKAIANQENILIYGDYDVDGITSTAVLWLSLAKIKAKVLPFIPNRKNDGYGFKASSFFKFQKEKNINFSLLITVDNGIVASKELRKITDQNIDVIVVDHHLSDSELPKTKALIHSTMVSGSVLSWLLAHQFDSSADIGLAALGAVADCLPLIGINRNVVVYGLQALQQNPNLGIKKLIETSGLNRKNLTSYDLSFILSPRINAIGRLSDPTDALRLLCSQNVLQASKYARILENFNKDRQTLQQDTIDLAEKYLSKNKNKLIFLADQSFHPGIIGLIASRFTEKYYLPSIVISVDKEFSKGSCRSIKELNIIETLRGFNNQFVELGGHAGAAGFTIETKNIKKFQTKITDFINKKFKDTKLKPSILVDAEMKLSAVTIKNCRLINKLEPFGIENNKPLFLFKNLRIIQKKLLGSQNNHLKLKLDDPKTPKLENIPAACPPKCEAFGVDAIAFKKGELDKKLKIGDSINIITGLDLNIWNNSLSPQLVIKEIFVI